MLTRMCALLVCLVFCGHGCGRGEKDPAEGKRDGAVAIVPESPDAALIVEFHTPRPVGFIWAFLEGAESLDIYIARQLTFGPHASHEKLMMEFHDLALAKCDSRLCGAVVVTARSMKKPLAYRRSDGMSYDEFVKWFQTGFADAMKLCAVPAARLEPPGSVKFVYLEMRDRCYRLMWSPRLRASDGRTLIFSGGMRFASNADSTPLRSLEERTLRLGKEDKLKHLRPGQEDDADIDEEITFQELIQRIK